jgi:hypothetical protein
VNYASVVASGYEVREDMVEKKTAETKRKWTKTELAARKVRDHWPKNERSPQAAGWHNATGKGKGKPTNGKGKPTNGKGKGKSKDKGKTGKGKGAGFGPKGKGKGKGKKGAKSQW